MFGQTMKSVWNSRNDKVSDLVGFLNNEQEIAEIKAILAVGLLEGGYRGFEVTLHAEFQQDIREYKDKHGMIGRQIMGVPCYNCILRGWKLPGKKLFSEREFQINVAESVLGPSKMLQHFRELYEAWIETGTVKLPPPKGSTYDVKQLPYTLNAALDSWLDMEGSFGLKQKKKAPPKALPKDVRIFVVADSHFTSKAILYETMDKVSKWGFSSIVLKAFDNMSLAVGWAKSRKRKIAFCGFFKEYKDMAVTADMLIAFWDGENPETQAMIKGATDNGMCVKVVKYKKYE